MLSSIVLHIVIQSQSVISILCSSIWIGLHILYEYNHFYETIHIKFPTQPPKCKCKNKYIKTTQKSLQNKKGKKKLQVLLTK